MWQRETDIRLRVDLFCRELHRFAVVVPAAEEGAIEIGALVAREDVGARKGHRAVHAPASRVNAHFVGTPLDADFLERLDRQAVYGAYPPRRAIHPVELHTV